MALDPFATTSMFHVSIGGLSLGDFSGCSGLGCEIETETRHEGGVNGHARRFPSRIGYPNIVLTRPLSRASALIWVWLESQTVRVVRSSAAITALAPDRTPILVWGLTGVLPCRWNGPAFDVGHSQPAVETLELSHEGFLEVTAP
ncbi:phage tail protein [Streptomyces yaizuensis]|uniref:Phage tail protein n=1 Tax=Streptomyces yaizuensis TaxID=2989713 RepID=A0ABQ5NY28_9ACTN|nr:phage tail protein [Streptomyces sp. YSPA8]GLF95275.1 phage tail protein [Streptomyces sp. YSPA8]